MNDESKEPKDASASKAAESGPEADVSLSGPPSEAEDAPRPTAAEREEARLHEPDTANAVAEAVRRAGGGEEAEKSTRPPLWLMVFTIMIPLAIGYMWYNSSYMRQMTCEEVSAHLQGSDASKIRHALHAAAVNIDEFNQSRSTEGVDRNWADVLPCAESVLALASTVPPDKQLYNDIARTLGSFHFHPEEAKRLEAFKWLEDVLDQTHEAGQNELTRFQAATSLSRFGLDYLRKMGTLRLVQDELQKMIQANSEQVLLSGAHGLRLVGTKRHEQELKSLADSNSTPDSVKPIAKEAAELCSQRLD